VLRGVGQIFHGGLKGDVLLFLGKDSLGEGVMKGLAGGSCPKPGRLTLPSPSPRKLFADLEKFFSRSLGRSRVYSRVENVEKYVKGLLPSPLSLGDAGLPSQRHRTVAVDRKVLPRSVTM